MRDRVKKFIPTLSDYLENMKLTAWMNNAMTDPKVLESNN
tara:strand:+ start:205 stop:324 length:120 start_codon:yes stop_codon:yes gene_type:complete